MRTRSAVFPDDAASVASARHLVADAASASGLGELEALAELLASELVTNAVRHAHGPVSVSASQATEGTMTVTVCDHDRKLPRLKRHGSSSYGGRGLQIVDAIADRWGVVPKADGKCIWFELVSDTRT
jgi:anti-sigma regulatory factor (Ser/Thr protein kinase)